SAGAKLTDLPQLTDGRIRHVAIANPAHAPYGRAAEQALRAVRVWDRVQAKLVYAEDIRQALRLVESSAAEAGLTALALANLPATALTRVTGIPLAWALARRAFPGRRLLDALVVSPLVLRPTVLGYYLLVLIGTRGPIGRVFEALSVSLAFTWRAAVIAAWLGSIPLLIKAAQAGFDGVDVRLEQAARTLGRSEWSIFWSVTLPLAWRSITAGVVLA